MKKKFTVAASLYRAFEDLVSSAIQSWLLAVRVPLRTSLTFFVIVQMFLLKYASQPSLHSYPTEYMEPDAKDKKMWALRASLETLGGLTSAVAIDCVIPPFGDITLIPMSNLLMLSTLPYFRKQCVVVPVSITSTNYFLRYNI